MRFFIHLSLFLSILVIFGDKSFSLTDYQIKKFCNREKRPSICRRSLKDKRFNLQKGNLIEIPVLPYKR